MKQAQQEFADKLKYLICSSTLLSPTITPHGLVSSPAALRSAEDEPKDAARIRLAVKAGLSVGSLIFAAQFLRALKACPSLVFAGLFLSATQLPFEAFRTKRTDATQQDLFRLIEQLLEDGQKADIDVDAALSKIKEMECIARGYGLSAPLPPISRIELSTFLPAAMDQPLRALPLREAIHQALSETKAACSEASRELEDHINQEELPSLLNMYHVIAEPPASPLPSPTFRDRRQRNSWHPQPRDQAPSSPIRSPDPRRRSSSTQALRNSWSPSMSRGPSRDSGIINGQAGLRLSLNSSTASTSHQQHEFLQPAFSEASTSTPRKTPKKRPLSFSHPPSTTIPSTDTYSLTALKRTFEDMHRERRRVLCCFLALSSAPTATKQAASVAQTVSSSLKSTSASVTKASQDFPSPIADMEDLPGSYTTAREQPKLRKRMSFLSSSTRQSFAPIDPHASIRKNHESYENNIQNISQGLRTVAAKLNVAGEDLRSALASGRQGDAERLLAIHDSVRGDLEGLMREYEDSRLALRKLVLSPSPRRPSLSEEEEDILVQSLSEEDEDPDLSASSTHRTSSIFSAETPELGSPPQFAQIHDYQSFSLLEPFGEEEQVFEGISSAEAKLSGSKLSREERIRAMKEQRDKKEERPLMAAEPMMSGESVILQRGRALTLSRAQRRHIGSKE